MPEMDLPDIALLSLPILILLLLIEMAMGLSGRIRAHYEPRDTMANMTVSAGSMLVYAVIGGLFSGGIVLAWQHRLFTIPLTWWSFLICFLLDDFRYYWFHRFSHRLRWFWAAHVVHHSSRHYNFSVAFRQSWTTGITGIILLNVPLAWIGFHPAVIALAASVNLIYQFWIHTESIRRMPAWFEWLLNTPSHHRVHHGSNPRYLDANYAGVLMIWDRLFGTFAREADEEPVRFGLVKDLRTFNPLRIAFHEYAGMWRDATMRGLSWRQRLGYIVLEPGWSHDGSRQTTADIRRAHGLEPDREDEPRGVTQVA